MPVTTLKIKKDDVENRLMFMTQQFDTQSTLNVYKCNEEFIPVGDPVVYEMSIEEESYHRNLRKEANERGHYVPEYSTNPEWNPDYVEPDSTISC